VLKKQPEFFAPPPPDPFEEADAEILEPAR
jgi:hypothetical protein